ncbi:RNA polymerase sigma factor [Pinibacter soli]|uniref:Sigma-70 family RNA polymerase sigma factor n=1 Tax=Pinibacter soli TaxID=3044211 RepID=A0ABT6RIG0_9BACT|nr:sigma-70 family RNA polymerase sigma factor [Pinibacter soli]MDI3322206.1 sigma-70 family RNA polymerase sigma factor [Pinibacter soli]
MAFLKKISPIEGSDADLVAQYKRTGNADILAHLYQQYMELVYGVCVKYLGDHEVAKDAVMNIYGELPVKVQKHIIDNFRSWLYAVAKNHCLMHLRSQKNKVTVSIDDSFMQSGEEMHPESAWDKEDQLVQMEDCLQTLAFEQKQSVELFYLQNKSYNEIMAITGYEWNKVRSLIQNGRRNLKICMEGKMVTINSK